MTIEIKDWSYNSYLHMIEYLYTAQIDNFNHTIALEVLGIADAYSIDNLKSLCENTLIHNVSNENVATLLIDGHTYSSQNLKKFCMNYIMKNFSDVKATKGFESLEGHPQLLMEIILGISNNQAL